MAPANSYQAGSVFTVKPQLEEPRRHEVVPGPDPTRVAEAWFHVAIVQFEDDGTPTCSSHLEAARQAILAARRAGDHGAIVVVFIHGWHHNAAWNRTPSTKSTDFDGDEHFHKFRLLLESLALRERERTGWRRVVGIYVGWNGNPETGMLRRFREHTVLTHASFWSRYRVAKGIGASEDLQKALRTIITTTKQPLPKVEGQPAPLQPESPI